MRFPILLGFALISLFLPYASSADCSTRPSLIAIDQANKTMLTDSLTLAYNCWTSMQRMGFNSYFNQIRNTIYQNTIYKTPAEKINQLIVIMTSYNKNGDLASRQVLLNVTINGWCGTIQDFIECGNVTSTMTTPATTTPAPTCCPKFASDCTRSLVCSTTTMQPTTTILTTIKPTTNEPTTSKPTSTPAPPTTTLEPTTSSASTPSTTVAPPSTPSTTVAPESTSQEPTTSQAPTTESVAPTTTQNPSTTAAETPSTSAPTSTTPVATSTLEASQSPSTVQTESSTSIQTTTVSVTESTTTEMPSTQPTTVAETTTNAEVTTIAPTTTEPTTIEPTTIAVTTIEPTTTTTEAPTTTTEATTITLSTILTTESTLAPTTTALNLCQPAPANSPSVIFNMLDSNILKDTAAIATCSCTNGLSKAFYTPVSDANPGNAIDAVSAACPDYNTFCMCAESGECFTQMGNSLTNLNVYPYCEGSVCHMYALVIDAFDGVSGVNGTQGTQFISTTQISADGVNLENMGASSVYLKVVSVSCNGCAPIQQPSCLGPLV